MKTTVITSLAGLAIGVTGLFFVPEAKAGVILPNLYAREYCSLRSIGVSEDEAMTAATEHAYLDNGETAVKVTIDGVRYDVDVVRAVRAATELCPSL